MYNRTIILGNLTKDIELRYLPSGSAIAKSSIAYTTGFGDNKKSHFIDVTFFGKLAETANQFLKKGSKVLLDGEIHFEQWTAQDGSNRSKHSLKVDEMKMLDSKPTQQEDYRGNGYQAENNSHRKQQNKIPEIDINEDEIPFNEVDAPIHNASKFI